MRKKDKQASSNSGSWLTTYSDLMTLLLAFFVLLFSMSSIEENKYEMMMNSLQNALIGSNGATIFENPSAKDDALISESPDEEATVVTPELIEEVMSSGGTTGEEPTTDELQEIVAGFLKDQGLDADVSVEIVEEGILLDVKQNVLFDLGKADIKSESLETLSRLGTLFDEFDQEVRVVGHTDNLPISTTQYPSNWELASNRACAIVRYYIRQGFESTRFMCTSYGDTMPIASNDTAEGRAKNRRVNFLIVANPRDIQMLSEVELLPKEN